MHHLRAPPRASAEARIPCPTPALGIDRSEKEKEFAGQKSLLPPLTGGKDMDPTGYSVR